MGDYSNQYKNEAEIDAMPVMVAEDEQLLQLLSVTFDADLISPDARTALVRKGFAIRCASGFNIITREGIELLRRKKLITP